MYAVKGIQSRHNPDNYNGHRDKVLHHHGDNHRRGPGIENIRRRHLHDEIKQKYQNNDNRQADEMIRVRPRLQYRQRREDSSPEYSDEDDRTGPSRRPSRRTTNRDNRRSDRPTRRGPRTTSTSLMTSSVSTVHVTDNSNEDDHTDFSKRPPSRTTNPNNRMSIRPTLSRVPLTSLMTSTLLTAEITGKMSTPRTEGQTMESVASTKAVITVLACVAGVMFLLAILLMLFLVWRKRRQQNSAPSTETGDKTYHLYSEIDHTTVILDDDPKVPNNQRWITEDKNTPDDVDNTYDRLHQKEIVEPNEKYNVLNPKFITPDNCVTIDGSEKCEPGQYFVLEPTSNVDNSAPQSGNNDQPANDNQYFVLEKMPEGMDTAKTDQECVPQQEPDTYFNLEPVKSD